MRNTNGRLNRLEKLLAQRQQWQPQLPRHEFTPTERAWACVRIVGRVCGDRRSGELSDAFGGFLVELTDAQATELMQRCREALLAQRAADLAACGQD